MITRKPLELATFVTVATLAIVCSSSAAAATRPGSKKEPPKEESTANTFVKSLLDKSNEVNGVTPRNATTTTDGGYIVLGSANSAKASGQRPVALLIKLSASGAVQWTRSVGCATTTTGGATGLSVVQASGGGYVVAGSSNCVSNPRCSLPSSFENDCGFVEKVSASGAVVWTKTYAPSAREIILERIRETSDHGFIVVGTAATDATREDVGSVLIKLGAEGNEQWEKELGPDGSTQTVLNDVRPTADGGFVATGERTPPTTTGRVTSSLLAVKLDGSGNVSWQRAFTGAANGGATNASARGQSIVQAADGGFLIGGIWFGASVSREECCSGALALKLDASGGIQWQKAYSGGLHCFENGFVGGVHCTNFNGSVESIERTADGGYVLAGDAHQVVDQEPVLVPWLAKIDAGGSLVWEHDYYRVNKSTGRNVSEYFSSSSLASDGGVFALGFTSDETGTKAELYAVRTNSSGLIAATCSDVHAPVNPESVLSPQLSSADGALALGSSTVTTGSASSAAVESPVVAARADC
jgi:hypothetical protein